eukprot:NODE_4810_length_1843_cov_14.541958.p1 GENE.NODE_4810_length_1843_cov_14.541958~~NODE_4810_length_1843_cov_14.541958.p1  ORF type:complete len:387 (-),score=86.28 NODE_4810_length_1843_cov_14.541958:566-1726(-)
MAMELPSLADAAAEPEVTINVVQSLVRASLAEEWRREHNNEGFLAALHSLIALHLDGIDVDAAALPSAAPAAAAPGDGPALPAPPPPLPACPHEEACAACLKLARNLCADCPAAQEFWHHCGLLPRLIDRLRADLSLYGDRGPAWSEAVPGFLTNSITGHAELRDAACAEWFPHGLAAACLLCWRRPSLAFVLTQNLSAGAAMLASADGHCVLYALVSLLCLAADAGEAESAKSSEWAGILLDGLWADGGGGGFATAYRGMKQLRAPRLHEFLLTAARAHEGVPPTGIGRLVARLCGHAEALGFLWHSIAAQLSDAPIDGGDSSAMFAQRLLTDPSFVDVAAARTDPPLRQRCVRRLHCAGLPPAHWWPPCAALALLRRLRTAHAP